MDKIDYKKVKKIWEKNNQKLVVPDVVVSYDKNKQVFFVYQDYSTIVFMILNKSNISYCIPKKYLVVTEGWYKITDISKLIPVSCPKKNKYENFVLENFLV